MFNANGSIDLKPFATEKEKTEETQKSKKIEETVTVQGETRKPAEIFLEVNAYLSQGKYSKAYELLEDYLEDRGLTLAQDTTKITHIDVHQKSIFIFWSKTTVNVYGE